MNSNVLTIEQMYQMYPDQWLLVACTQLDDHLETLEGEVIQHSTDRDLIYNAIASHRSTYKGTLAIEYTGTIPDDYAFILSALPLNQEHKQSLALAALSAIDDYQPGSDLLAFESLDGEDFV